MANVLFIGLICVFVCFPKKVVADGSTTGSISGAGVAIVCVCVFLYCLCKCCKCRVDDDDGPRSTGYVIKRPQPEIQVIAKHERYDYVETEHGAGLVHTTVVADSDGNAATRQSIYAISN